MIRLGGGDPSACFKVDKNLENANNLYYILNIDGNNVRMGEMDMSMVTVSSKYQVVIPKQVREKANIKPGTKLQMVEVNGIIQMVPVIPILEMRGYFKGHEIEYAREKKDRL